MPCYSSTAKQQYSQFDLTHRLYRTPHELASAIFEQTQNAGLSADNTAHV
ncbi:MAG TPA: hypothetical protein V6D06_06810 [Trichocoleus sp.]